MKRNGDIHTTEGKRKFIKNFLDSVRDELLAKAKDMPEEWDGFELRWLVADKFEYEQYFRGDPGYRRRYREYGNERVVRNL